MKTDQRHLRDRLPAWPALLPLFLLAACATQKTSMLAHYPAPPAARPLPVAVAPVMAPDNVSPLLSYHQSLRRMTQGELLKELSGLLQLQRTPKVTLQTGMVLMLTRGGGDLARAQGLFDNVAASGDEGLRPLAQLLASYCTEARRLAEQSERLAGQVKDSQRKTEQLNDTLEALKAIERGLPARPGSGASAGAGASASGGAR